MTVQDLLDILENMDPDAEIRFAHQPSWPFEYSIADAVEVEPDEEANFENWADPDADATPTVYLVEGRQLGYLPGNVAEQIGWN